MILPILALTQVTYVSGTILTSLEDNLNARLQQLEKNAAAQNQTFCICDIHFLDPAGVGAYVVYSIE